MTYRPPISPKHNDSKTTINLTKMLVKDTDIIEKLIQLCKELGLSTDFYEDAKSPRTRVLITIPYKEVWL